MNPFGQLKLHPYLTIEFGAKVCGSPSSLLGQLMVVVKSQKCQVSLIVLFVHILDKCWISIASFSLIFPGLRDDSCFKLVYQVVDDFVLAFALGFLLDLPGRNIAAGIKWVRSRRVLVERPDIF